MIRTRWQPWRKRGSKAHHVVIAAIWCKLQLLIWALVGGIVEISNDFCTWLIQAAPSVLGLKAPLWTKSTFLSVCCVYAADVSPHCLLFMSLWMGWEESASCHCVQRLDRCWNGRDSAAFPTFTSRFGYTRTSLIGATWPVNRRIPGSTAAVMVQLAPRRSPSGQTNCHADGQMCRHDPQRSNDSLTLNPIFRSRFFLLQQAARKLIASSLSSAHNPKIKILFFSAF